MFVPRDLERSCATYDYDHLRFIFLYSLLYIYRSEDIPFHNIQDDSYRCIHMRRTKCINVLHAAHPSLPCPPLPVGKGSAGSMDFGIVTSMEPRSVGGSRTKGAHTAALRLGSHGGRCTY